jgi:hypothetical protein
LAARLWCGGGGGKQASKFKLLAIYKNRRNKNVVRHRLVQRYRWMKGTSACASLCGPDRETSRQRTRERERPHAQSIQQNALGPKPIFRPSPAHCGSAPKYLRNYLLYVCRHVGLQVTTSSTPHDAHTTGSQDKEAQPQLSCPLCLTYKAKFSKKKGAGVGEDCGLMRVSEPANEVSGKSKTSQHGNDGDKNEEEPQRGEVSLGGRRSQWRRDGRRGSCGRHRP